MGLSALAQVIGSSAAQWAEQPVETGENIGSDNYLFGRQARVTVNGMTFVYGELDMDIDIPFDDDTEPNEAEITVYNLSWNSISRLGKGQSITVEAGYGDDTGVIFAGRIDRIQTGWDGPDLAVTMKCLDDVAAKTVESIKFPKGTRASEILSSLLEKTGTPVASFEPARDKVYERDETVDGDLMSEIKKYADVCGISTYVIKGKVYARPPSSGDSIGFTVSENTGLIGSPEYFEEEETADGKSAADSENEDNILGGTGSGEKTDRVKATARDKTVTTGYKVKLLLQHRIQTASLVKLSSLLVQGSFRVRSGKHVINESDFYTEIEVV